MLKPPKIWMLVVAGFIAAKVIAVGVAYIGAKSAGIIVSEEASEAVDTAMKTVVEINAAEAAGMAAGEVVAVAAGSGWRYFKICGQLKKGPKICFAPGTLVLMGDGTTKAIEYIEKGDFVTGHDPEDNKPAGPFEVTAIHKNSTYRLFQINIGESHIKATSRHPFWTQRGWVASENLTASDLLYDQFGNSVKIDGIEAEFLDSPTYNLSADRVSTFFVVAGDTPVLVHNIDPWEIQYSRSVKPDELFQHGVWKDRKVSDAILEARKLGRLPEGLELRVARYYSVTGEEVMAASTNRTLYVAQEAGLTHVHAVNDIDSPKAYGEVQRQLKFSAGKGGTDVTFWRCP